MSNILSQAVQTVLPHEKIKLNVVAGRSFFTRSPRREQTMHILDNKGNVKIGHRYVQLVAVQPPSRLKKWAYPIIGGTLGYVASKNRQHSTVTTIMTTLASAMIVPRLLKGNRNEKDHYVTLTFYDERANHSFSIIVHAERQALNELRQLPLATRPL